MVAHWLAVSYLFTPYIFDQYLESVSVMLGLKILVIVFVIKSP